MNTAPLPTLISQATPLRQATFFSGALTRSITKVNATIATAARLARAAVQARNDAYDAIFDGKPGVVCKRIEIEAAIIEPVITLALALDKKVGLHTVISEVKAAEFKRLDTIRHAAEDDLFKEMKGRGISAKNANDIILHDKNCRDLTKVASGVKLEEYEVAQKDKDESLAIELKKWVGAVL